MIAGIGIDLVPVEKIAESVESEAFRQRVFTPAEIEACRGIYNAAERYAGKFAAKEAFMKAVGRGIRQEVWFSQIEVLSSETGAPYILVHGEAERALQALEAKTVHVSISHTREAAIAIVIVEGPG
jgi:holo-[acyl-carrier protein] synthase